MRAVRLPLSADPQQTEADSLDDGLLPAADLEFLLDIRDMEIDGRFRAVQYP